MVRHCVTYLWLHDKPSQNLVVCNNNHFPCPRICGLGAAEQFFCWAQVRSVPQRQSPDSSPEVLIYNGGTHMLGCGWFQLASPGFFTWQQHSTGEWKLHSFSRPRHRTPMSSLLLLSAGQRLSRPSQIQGVGERTLPLGGKTCKELVDIFIYIHNSLARNREYWSENLGRGLVKSVDQGYIVSVLCPFTVCCRESMLLVTMTVG